MIYTQQDRQTGPRISKVPQDSSSRRRVPQARMPNFEMEFYKLRLFESSCSSRLVSVILDRWSGIRPASPSELRAIIKV